MREDPRRVERRLVGLLKFPYIKNIPCSLIGLLQRSPTQTLTGLSKKWCLKTQKCMKKG